MKKEDLVVGVRLSNLATRGKVSAIGNFYFLLQLEGGEEIKVSKSMLTDYDIIQDTKYVSPALYKLNNGHFYVSSELFENVEDAIQNGDEHYAITMIKFPAENACGPIKYKIS